MPAVIFVHKIEPHACLHQGQIYVINDLGFESYNPETNEWTLYYWIKRHADFRKRSDPNYIASRKLVSIDGRLLSIGGRSFYPEPRALKSVFEFDLERREWIPQPDMDTERDEHGAFTVQLP